MNMIIRSWDFDKGEWKYRIRRQWLGTLQDDQSFRRYNISLDQIERTERLLRLVWREINEPKEPDKNTPDYQSKYKDYESKYKTFSDNYDLLDQKSTEIRATAKIMFESFLLGA
ncbi:hypothetical protein HYR99_12820 [Candidatus Poribacteria bacterium]|nr:hypothetical protein [Candidatus Poribacteria bacterium]